MWKQSNTQDAFGQLSGGREGLCVIAVEGKFGQITLGQVSRP